MNNPLNNLEDEIRRIGSLGFDYLELTVEWSHATAEIVNKSMKNIKDLLSTCNLSPLLTHAPWYFPIAHPYNDMRKSVIEEYTKIIEVSAVLGAEMYTMHTEPFPYVYKNRKDLIENTIDTIARLAKVSDDNGIVLSIENYNNQSFSIQDFQELYSRLPDLRMTLDIGHANTIKPKNEGIYDYLAAFKKEIIHMHVHDNKGITDDHLPLGTGTINWPEAIKKIKSTGYDRTMTIEVHSQDQEYLKISREKLENMLNQA